MNTAEMFGEALAHHRGGRLPQAEQIYRRLLALEPHNVDALYMLGVLAGQTGHHAAAIALLRQVLALAPAHLDAIFELGNLHHTIGELDQSLAWFLRGTAIAPQQASSWSNLGNAHYAMGNLDEAIASYQRAIALAPREPVPRNNLGNALKEARRVEEAIASYRRAVELQPDLAAAHSNLVYTLHFDPAYDAAAILAEHRHWARQHAAPLAASIPPLENDRAPHRRLRIGYVSPDFREHSVGRFMLPLLAEHDHATFEIQCFSDVAVADWLTGKLRGMADRWHDIAAMPDAAVAELVRREKIDILVDLSLHMTHNRMLVLARKPAPVQVTYLAYAGTSGLETMDYRFTDRYLDPEGEEEHYVEKSIRLRSYWCYGEPPAFAAGDHVQSKGFVRFGCLNTFSKVSDAALAAWKRILDATPKSRLLFVAAPGSHRQRAAAELGEGRVEFIGSQSLADYLSTYNRIDVALDPFPYCGGTTSCDAMWMGVPVVTLAGRTAVGRGGVSLLSQLKLTELIASGVEEYVATATRLAGDLEKLADLRKNLRQRMRASPLCKTRDFARDVEEKYRAIWTAWCERRIISA